VSKYGERTISVTVAIFFLMKHVLIPILSYFIKKTAGIAHKTFSVQNSASCVHWLMDALSSYSSL
jgi:hypothetical protein